MSHDVRGIPTRGGPVIHRATIAIVKSIRPEDMRGSGSCLGTRTQEFGLYAVYLWFGIGGLILEISARHKSNRALTMTAVIGPLELAG